MPTPIDRCSSCHSPVYVEPGIPGGCGCQERDLRILLARKRAADSGHSRVASAALPALTPELLMSAEGRREFQAAQSTSPSPRLQGRTTEAVLIDDAGSWPAEGDFSEERIATVSAPNLEAMWLQGSGIPYDPEAFIAQAPNDIEFSSDDIDIDTAAGPRPVGRTASTRVDRPQVEIGRAGRFPIIDAGRTLSARADQDRDRVNREALARSILESEDREVFRALNRAAEESPRPSREPILSAKEANTRQFAKTLQEKQKLPTVYDRLQKGFFDDED